MRGGNWFDRCAAIGLVSLFAATANAQDWSRVPGVPIAYLEAPPRIFGFPYNEAYIGSPSITILADGTYIATHDVFGSGTPENTTWVYRSTNQGQSWSQLTSVNAFWSTVFSVGNDVYIIGPKEEGDDDDLILRKSTNKGQTWTTATIITGNFGGSPNTPVIYNNRIWVAYGSSTAVSAPVGSDLMNPSSWTKSNGETETPGQNFFGSSWQGWSEGQIAASPQTGVIIMPKVRSLPFAGLVNVTSPTNTTMSDEQFVSLPGAEKKFGVQYDATSGKFYALTNVVLPAHANDDVLAAEPELIRNTGAILTSRDAVNWDVESIFLYTPNIDTDPDTGWGEAFQYFNYAFDGSDLAVVSRTAIDVGDGENKPPRGHDSNLMTFHRIEDFRTLEPDQYLKLENGTVNRYERTQHKDAPLGKFALAATFDGVALTNPNGIADDADLNIYIREAGGRILKFDPEGNYLGTVAALPAGNSWHTSLQDVKAPSRDNRSWNKDATADWNDPLNWVYWGRPDTNEEVAMFGSANTTTRYARIRDGETFTVKGLHFNSPNRYIIDNQVTSGGTGALILEAATGNASIVVDNGDHWIRVTTTLNSNTDLTVAAGQRLEFRKSLDLHGKTLFVKGAGTLDFDQVLTLNGGTLKTDGLSPIVFSSPTLGQLNLNGNFEFAPDASLNLAVGQSFNLHDGTDNFNGQTFSKIILPVLSGIRGWSTSSFYSNGTVSVVNVASPQWANNASGNWTDPLNWINYGRPDSTAEIARFTNINTATRTVHINTGETFTVKGLNINSTNRYTIDGAGDLRLDADSGHAKIDILAGYHFISVNTKLYDHLDITVPTLGDQVRFAAGTLDLNGKTLYKLGAGWVAVHGATFVMHGGKIVTDGLSAFAFNSGSDNKITLDGDFVFTPDSSLNLVAGASFDLLNGQSYLRGETFDSLTLPTLGPRLVWNASNFYGNGVVTIQKYLLTGDADADGIVSAADITYIEQHFGATGLADGSLLGDANFDGRVDGADLLAVERNLGSALPTFDPVSIPEPAALTLLLTAPLLKRRPRH